MPGCLKKNLMRNVLLLCKISAYQTYFRNQKNFPKHIRLQENELERFQRTHVRHNQTIMEIERVLAARGIRYRKATRKEAIDYSRYDCVMTVGGDGTFLEAAGQVSEQLILGINSDPEWSVGRFCTAEGNNFSKVLDKILRNQYLPVALQRLRVRFKYQRLTICALNDLLICHKNPAAMSRYCLTIKGFEEEQRSSGIWIATAAGSTGAIHSAGGKVLVLTSKQLQYRPRELYDGRRARYRLKGAVLAPSQDIKIFSLMKDGAIYVDGFHHHYPFHFGDEVKVDRFPRPLNLIKVKP